MLNETIISKAINKIFYNTDPCGSGKTLKMCMYVSKSNNKTIIVHNSIALIKQTVSFFDGCATAIYSSVEQDTSVMDRVVDFIRNQSNRILVISDKTFWRISISLLDGYEIFIDDVATVVDYMYKNEMDEYLKGFIKNKLFSERDEVPHNSNYITAVKQEVSGDFQQSIRDDFSIADNNDFFTMNKEWFDDDNKGQLTVLGYKDLNKYAHLNITFMANDFKNTMVYLAFPDLFVEVDSKPLKQRTIPLEQRLSVKYFCKNKALSATWKNENPEKLKKIYDYLNVELNGTKYYWTKNKKDGGVYNLSGTFITPDSRGLNQYQDYNTCVWLACMKPSPVEHKCLEDILNITYHQVVQARELEVLHQFTLRGVSRQYDSSEIQTVYVFDEEQALSLVSNPEYIDLGIDDEDEPKKVGAPTKLVKIPQAISKRKYKFIQKCKKDGITIEIGMFRKWVHSLDDCSDEVQNSLIDQFTAKGSAKG